MCGTAEHLTSHLHNVATTCTCGACSILNVCALLVVHVVKSKVGLMVFDEIQGALIFLQGTDSINKKRLRHLCRMILLCSVNDILSMHVQGESFLGKGNCNYATLFRCQI